MTPPPPPHTHTLLRAPTRIRTRYPMRDQPDTSHHTPRQPSPCACACPVGHPLAGVTGPGSPQPSAVSHGDVCIRFGSRHPIPRAPVPPPGHAASPAMQQPRFSHTCRLAASVCCQASEAHSSAIVLPLPVGLSSRASSRLLSALIVFAIIISCDGSEHELSCRGESANQHSSMQEVTAFFSPRESLRAGREDNIGHTTRVEETGRI